MAASTGYAQLVPSSPPSSSNCSVLTAERDAAAPSSYEQLAQLVAAMDHRPSSKDSKKQSSTQDRLQRR